MLRRNVGVILVAGVVLGGAALAGASGAPERPTVVSAAQPAPEGREGRQARRETLRACLQQAGENAESRRACFSAAAGSRLGKRPPDGRRPGPLALMGRAVHGSLVVPAENGGWQTVTFDRGVVDEATDGSKIVLDRRDGQSATVALTSETKYHGVENAAAIAEGRPATVVSREGKALHVVQKDRRGRQGNNEPPAVVPND